MGNSHISIYDDKKYWSETIPLADEFKHYKRKKLSDLTNELKESTYYQNSQFYRGHKLIENMYNKKAIYAFKQNCFKISYTNSIPFYNVLNYYDLYLHIPLIDQLKIIYSLYEEYKLQDQEDIDSKKLNFIF